MEKCKTNDLNKIGCVKMIKITKIVGNIFIKNFYINCKQNNTR